MEQRGQEYDSWEELVEKAIDAEAKASLQPSSILREMDQRCLRGKQSAYFNVTKSQTSCTRYSHSKPVKKLLPLLAPKPSNSSLAGSSKTSDKKTWKDKKKH